VWKKGSVPLWVVVSVVILTNSNQSIHSTNVLPFDKTKTKTKIMKNKKIIISDDIETEPDTDTDDVNTFVEWIDWFDGNPTGGVPKV
jgi:hypothetical protein